MHLRLLRGRLSILLIRGGILLKIAITSLILLFIFLAWWLFLFELQVSMKNNLNLHIEELQTKKNIFKDVLSEYENLKSTSRLIKKNKSDVGDYNDGCLFVVKKSIGAGLEIQSYAKKSTKAHYKQASFVFNGNYKELLFFLNSLDYKKTCLNCIKLKVSRGSCRLQITYVCGIHTFIKA